MERKQITINKGQHLTDVYSQIESNTILCKTLTGLGATYSEITAKRNSIIVVPNIPAITGKCPKHKKDNLFGVKQKITTSDVVKYIETTTEANKRIKLIATPESFYKVKDAFDELEINMYVNCFLLLDECHKIIKDIDYRPDIALPIDDFFRFDEKALVSATPIIPSDPRFKEQNFKIVEIVPTFNYQKELQLIHTNNMLEAFKQILPLMINEQSAKRSICFFINSTDMIFQLVTKLGIVKESSVFCSDKSVAKLKSMGFKQAYDDWNEKHKRQFIFFTSRFYNALDIEIEEKPDIVFVSEPYFAEHTIVDPYTDVVQSIGRFRNGISSVTHILSTKATIQQRSKEGLIEFLKGSEHAYNIIRTLYRSAQSIEERNAYSLALKSLPYNTMLINDRKNYFAIDNYIDDELVKTAYNNIDAVVTRYIECGYFTIHSITPLMFKFGENDRLSLFGTVRTKRDLRERVVAILDNIKEDMGTALFDSYIEELREKDCAIVDAYFSLGKEVIEQNNYRMKILKEMMLTKEFNETKNSDIFRKALLNSFEIGRKYRLSYIKEELIRLHFKFKVRYPKSVTAQTIHEYFNVIDTVRIGNDKAMLIISPKI